MRSRSRGRQKKYGQIKSNPDEYYRTPARRLFGVSGYLLFSSDQRQKRFPEKITVTELGHMWSNLNNKEKAKYNEKAEKLRNKIYDADEKKKERKEQEKERFAENELRLTSSRGKVPKHLDIDYYEELLPTKSSDKEKGVKRDYEQGKTADVVNDEENLKNINPLEISTGEYEDEDERDQKDKGKSSRGGGRMKDVDEDFKKQDKQTKGKRSGKDKEEDQKKKTGKDKDEDEKRKVEEKTVGKEKLEERKGITN